MTESTCDLQSAVLVPEAPELPDSLTVPSILGPNSVF